MRTIPALRWFFGVAAGLAAVAGVLLFIGANETDRFFSWPIEPPLTAAFLGAAYWAALVLLAWAARQREWDRARTALPPVFSIAVLLLIATLVHLENFDLDSLFGWFWLTVYVLVTPLLVVMILRQPGAFAPSPPPAGVVPAWVRSLLLAQSVVMLGLGAALFIAPDGVGSLWPWDLTPLNGRAVGAFVFGFGVAGAFALWDGDLSRLRGAAWAFGTLGALELVGLAIHSSDVTGSGAEVGVYVAFCVSVLAVGLYGSVAGRASREPSAVSGSR